jgi:nuclear pore complex protein Nup133
MAQSSRQRLAIDAEKLAASHQLWLQHNERLMCVLIYSSAEELVNKDMQQGRISA